MNRKKRMGGQKLTKFFRTELARTCNRGNRKAPRLAGQWVGAPQGVVYTISAGKSLEFGPYMIARKGISGRIRLIG